MKKYFTAIALLLLALPAHAAGGGGEENIFGGDLGNMIWTLVTFVLVLLVLKKFAWGPVLENLQGREDFIRESLDKAKQDRDDAEARLAEYTGKLEEARAEATAIVEEGRRDAEVVRAKIEEQAKEEADKMIDRAKREIDVAKSTAVREVYETSARLATNVASTVIKREVSASDHERLIQEAIDQLGEQDLN